MTKSSFKGSAVDIFIWNLALIFSIYLFIIPVVFVFPKYCKWFYSQIEIDGKELKFEEDGPYWGIIGWILFMFVTLGFGSFYAMKKISIWTIQRVKVVGEEDKESDFEGSAMEIFAYSLLVGFSSYLFFIPVAWTFVMLSKFMMKSTKISGKYLELDYEGPYWGILGWVLFIFVTFGFGGWYAQKKIFQWQYEHTHFVEY